MVPRLSGGVRLGKKPGPRAGWLSVVPAHVGGPVGFGCWALLVLWISDDVAFMGLGRPIADAIIVSKRTVFDGAVPAFQG